MIKYITTNSALYVVVCEYNLNPVQSVMTEEQALLFDHHPDSLRTELGNCLLQMTQIPKDPVEEHRKALNYKLIYSMNKEYNVREKDE